jgi:hypothetical protein
MSSSLAVRIGWSVLLAVLLLLSFTQYLDNGARKDHNEILKRSLFTFGLVKALNGTLSMIQGTEIEAAPAGIGFTFTVGEVLDPINDLVERFSWVMLVSSVSLGAQKIILEVGNWWPIKAVLVVVITILLCRLWVPRFTAESLTAVAYKALLVSLILRFSMPCIAIANQEIYRYFLGDTYKQATQVLKETEDSASGVSKEIMQDEGAATDTSILGKAREAYNGLKRNLKLKERVKALVASLKETTRYMIDLITVFVLQSVLIPIIVLWALLRFCSYVFDHDFPKTWSGRRIGVGPR